MEERIQKLEKEIDWMQQLLIALVLMQDIVNQHRIMKAFPQLKPLIERLKNN